MSELNRFSTTRPLFGQTALVTGASRGIGAAIALALAKAGARVAINYVHEKEKAENIAKQCQSLGARTVVLQADIANTDDVNRMVAQCKAELGPISILVNNAGKAQSTLFLDTSIDLWDQLMNINLKGTYLCTKAALPAMVEAQYGRIINISSVWGIAGGSCEVAYSAAKGGVNALTKALAKELGKTGITVNAVAPGAIATDMLRDLDEDDLKKLSEDTPVGRLGTPQDIANAVLFLASPDSSFMTGQIISPNGGFVV
nr:3-oxoacyl-ACP reductase FabG [Bacilli bacterium]